MTPLLELRGINVHYGGVKALADVSLALMEGEIVALMGPNGAGKSTILKTIFGLAPIDSGQICFAGEPIVPVSYEVVREGIAFVPQGRRIFPHLTVGENLEIGAFAVKDASERSRRAVHAFEMFPVLLEKRRIKAGALSGGEQQMLALARGHMVNPRVMLLDEPSLGLAPKIVREVFQKIWEINERHGTAILVVEHNIKSLLDIVHRGYVLDKGRVVAEGDVPSLRRSEILEKIFVGAPIEA